MRTGGFIQTFTGGQYWPLDPHPDDVRIEDIAHALSLLCRYTGQINRFYSVAEHSIHVMRLVPVRHKYHALLHDAQEAYVNDLSKPFKKGLPSYNQAEKRNEWAVGQALGLAEHEPAEVKDADTTMLWVERRELFSHPPAADWGMGLTEPDPYPELGYLGWPSQYAEEQFLKAYRSLKP